MDRSSGMRMGINASKVSDIEAIARTPGGIDRRGRLSIWLERLKAGTFGCHELLDRTSWISNLLGESVLSHPACVSNPEWFALAESALTAMTDLYRKWTGAVWTTWSAILRRG